MMKVKHAPHWVLVILLSLVWLGSYEVLLSPLAHADLRSTDSQVLRKGVLLIANPNLEDLNFKKSVVLVCEYGPGGAIGLIINRPMDIPLSNVFPDLGVLEGKPYVLFSGGPVQPRGLLMLFRSEVPSSNSKEVFDGVYWGSDREVIASMAANPNQREGFRVYAGYAGWANGQLEAEIALGGWTTVQADPESLFEKDPTTLWNELNNLPASPREFISYPTDLTH